jgi:uncharacterized surface protein with fasciclin (FAS1) repeats
MKHAPLSALVAAALLALAPAAGAQSEQRFFVADTVQPRPDGDVLEVAAAAGQFTHFLEAVEAAGYSETLRGEGPFTIFAPTDAAFRQMREGEWERLLNPHNRDELLALMAYHVVAERITSETAGDGVTRPEAASGYRLTLDGGDGLRVNDVLVAIPDMEARNGVLHGVNTVLAPPVMVASR